MTFETTNELSPNGINPLVPPFWFSNSESLGDDLATVHLLRKERYVDEIKSAHVIPEFASSVVLDTSRKCTPIPGDKF